MSYAPVIPPQLVEGMYHVREATGVSIRKQILKAIERQLKEVSAGHPDGETADFKNPKFSFGMIWR